MSKLLLVEDSVTQTLVIKGMLEEKGFHVVTAKNGLEGVNLAVQERPDVIITDALMPDMDGFSMCRRLKQNSITRDIPVIMLTVLSSVHDMVLCLENGVNDFINKPFTERELITSIEQLQAYRQLRLERVTYSFDLFDKVFTIDQQQQQILGKILKKMARMEKIVLESMDIIVVTDVNGFITEMNFGAESAFNIGRKDAIGVKTIDQLFIDPDKPLELAAKLKNNERVVDHEAEMKDFHGNRVDVMLNLTFLKSGRDEVDGYIYLAKDITERKRHEEELLEKARKLEVLSYTDPLTGLGNRRAFDNAVGIEIERNKRHGLPLSILFLDIDNFKLFNDAYGHPEGDMVLKRLADCIQGTIRTKIDHGCRQGGEEFSVILPNTTGDGAKVVADRIRLAFAKIPFTVKDNQPDGTGEERNVFCSVSVGVTQYHAGLTADECIRAADIALYQAKRAGKNCLRYYERLPERTRPYHLLMLTDDVAVAGTVEEMVKQFGNLTVSVATTHNEALSKATEHNPDLVLVDNDCRGMDTVELFANIRKLRPTRRMPVFILESGEHVSPKDVSEDMGPTDYLQKPLDAKLFGKKIADRLFHILDQEVLRT